MAQPAWRRRFLPFAMTVLCVATGVALKPALCYAQIEQDPHEALRDSLMSMTGAELEDLLFNPPPLVSSYTTSSDYQRRQIMEMSRGYVLHEMLRRDDKKWSIPVLQKALRRLRPMSPTNPKLDQGCDLAILTALRRAEGSPDPLELTLHTPSPLKTSRERLPLLKLSLKNVDADKETIYLHQDGYPLDRWRVVIKCADGREVDPSTQYTGFGGARVGGPLKPGATWETEIPLRDVVQAPPLGQATLQVLFHNDYHLTRHKDLSCLVLLKSKVIDLSVHKTIVYTNARDTELVHQLVKDLNGDDPLKIIEGTYGAWAYNTLGKDTAAGKLLTIGAPAVPPLVELVQDEQLSANKRAWLLSLLYSLTGENDPRKDLGLLSSYRYVRGPWGIWTDKNPEPAAGNVRTVGGGGSRTTNRAVDAERLQKFAAQWKTWLAANCEVREEAEE